MDYRNYIRQIFKNYEQNIRIVEKYSNNFYLEEESIEYLHKDINRELNIAKREIILRDLLYLQLDNDEKRIFDYIFIYKMKVKKIIRIMYISESTYHRLIRKIYTKLSKYLDNFKIL